MSGKTLFVIDIDRCWGCRTCETACGIENSTSPPLSGISVLSHEFKNGSETGRHYLPVVCQQCESAECILACPAEALSRNPDGTISVVSGNCIGCGKCEKACPFGAITLDRELNVAVKCDMCLDRRNVGGNPSCVHHCIGGALAIMDEAELPSLERETNTHRCGNVVYTSQSSTFGSHGV